MPRVAIVGSCITRDLWPIRGGGAEGLLYVSRTSLPSLFSPAARGFSPFPDRPQGLGDHQHRAVLWDLGKQALAALAAHRPTHLIFDFIDERFDLLRVAGTLATHSWELEASGYLGRAPLVDAQPIPRLSEPCERLWMTAVEELAAFLRETPLRDAMLVLHEARWADTLVDAQGVRAPITGVEIMRGKPADTFDHNALLARYEAAFLAAAPRARRVAAGGLRLADAAHRWGPSPFHYTADYYQEIRRQLADLGI